MIREHGLTENIVFLPGGGKKFLTDLLNSSKIFVMTSQGEGLPMAVVEAMSCSLPVVIFDDADNTDICKHDYNSLVCELWDTDAFADNVRKLLTDHELYNRLAANANKLRDERSHDYSLAYALDLWKGILQQVDSIKR
ncbi:MAG: glycosyltransferase family 4 protein [Bacteroidales bacterium]|nr:glycosyltransferase family 4 protein [Bacteroidales bacterium]